MIQIYFSEFKEIFRIFLFMRGAFPLQRELDALGEYVDSMRVDLLQTSMLNDYAKDFLMNYKF